MSAFLLAFLTLLLALLLKIARPLSRYVRNRLYLSSALPSAPNYHWLKGNIAPSPEAKKQHLQNFVKVLPRNYIFWLGWILPFVALPHPETLADAMRTGPGKFQFVYAFFKPWLENGLVTSAGKRWARDRRLMSHVFTPAMLREYVPVFKEACGVMLNLWQAQLVDGSVDVGKSTSHLAFDVILMCTLGVDSDVQSDTEPNGEFRRYLLAVEETSHLVVKRYMQLWTWSDFVYYRTATGRRFSALCKELHEFSLGYIRKRREELEEGQRVGGEPHGLGRLQKKDMLDILLTVRDESGVGLSDNDIRQQMDTFLWAGRDTTAATLQWAVHYLVENPDIQERCRAEAVRVMEECGGLDGFHHEHIGQLQYLSQFVKETLRHACIVASVPRTLSRETLVDGVMLPAGTNIHINILGIHSNEQVWEDPQTFNPDRFAPGRAPSHPYAFIPFAVGARNCIGKHFAQDKVKVVLAMILMRYVLLPEPEAKKPFWNQVTVAFPSPSLKVRLREL